MSHSTHIATGSSSPSSSSTTTPRQPQIRPFRPDDAAVIDALPDVVDSLRAASVPTYFCNRPAQFIIAVWLMTHVLTLLLGLVVLHRGKHKTLDTISMTRLEAMSWQSNVPALLGILFMTIPTLTSRRITYRVWISSFILLTWAVVVATLPVLGYENQSFLNSIKALAEIVQLPIWTMLSGWGVMTCLVHALGTTSSSSGHPLVVLSGACIAMVGLLWHIWSACQCHENHVVLVDKSNADHALQMQCQDGPWSWSQYPALFGDILVWVGVDLIHVSALIEDSPLAMDANQKSTMMCFIRLITFRIRRLLLAVVSPIFVIWLVHVQAQTLHDNNNPSAHATTVHLPLIVPNLQLRYCVTFSRQDFTWILFPEQEDHVRSANVPVSANRTEKSASIGQITAHQKQFDAIVHDLKQADEVDDIIPIVSRTMNADSPLSTIVADYPPVSHPPFSDVEQAAVPERFNNDDEPVVLEQDRIPTTLLPHEWTKGGEPVPDIDFSDLDMQIPESQPVSVYDDAIIPLPIQGTTSGGEPVPDVVDMSESFAIPDSMLSTASIDDLTPTVIALSTSSGGEPVPDVDLVESLSIPASYMTTANADEMQPMTIFISEGGEPVPDVDGSESLSVPASYMATAIADDMQPTLIPLSGGGDEPVPDVLDRDESLTVPISVLATTTVDDLHPITNLISGGEPVPDIDISESFSIPESSMTATSADELQPITISISGGEPVPDMDLTEEEEDRIMVVGQRADGKVPSGEIQQDQKEALEQAIINLDSASTAEGHPHEAEPPAERVFESLKQAVNARQATNLGRLAANALLSDKNTGLPEVPPAESQSSRTKETIAELIKDKIEQQMKQYFPDPSNFGLDEDIDDDEMAQDGGFNPFRSIGNAIQAWKERFAHPTLKRRRFERVQDLWLANDDEL